MFVNYKLTFNLPNFNGQYLKCFGDNTDAVGTYGIQTLPNIIGFLRAAVSQGCLSWSGSGALYDSRYGNVYVNNNFSTAYNLNDTINLDASRSNSVYRDYNVNPYNVVMMVCIKY